MREGSVLFLNELNRLPEAAQNLLLPALDEGLVEVPHLGRCAPPTGSWWWRRRTRRSTWRPGTCPRRCATGSSTWRWGTRRRRRKSRSSPRRPGVPTPRSCARPCASCAARGCTRDVRRGASVRGAIAHGGAGRRREETALRSPAALRAAAEIALTTRVDLRDGDAGLGDVLDELVELVVEQGARPGGGGAGAVGRAPVRARPARRGPGRRRSRAMRGGAARAAGAGRSARWRTAARWRSRCARRPKTWTAGSSPAT